MVNENELLKRIEINANVLAGKPIVRGYRISVEQIVKSLAAGWTTKDVLQNFPELNEQDILACLFYAGKLLEDETVYKVA